MVRRRFTTPSASLSRSRSRLLSLSTSMPPWSGAYPPSAVGASHVVVARGRDYTDVSPTRGVFRGGGGHTLKIGVTVEPEAEPAA